MNAYVGWLNNMLFERDAFDGCLGLLVLIGTLGVALVALLFALCIVVVLLGGQPETHGSCRYQHWAGKFYACDEYYPLPQAVHP